MKVEDFKPSKEMDSTQERGGRGTSVRGDLKQISVIELHVYKSRSMNSLIPHEGVTCVRFYLMFLQTGKIQCVCCVFVLIK